MAFETTEFAVKLVTTTTLFGSCPDDPSIYETYIQKEIDSTTEKAIAEREALPLMNEDEQKVTVFLRMNGQPALFAHVIKGYLKSACGALTRTVGTCSGDIRAYKKVIDLLIFPSPDIIPVIVGNGPIEHLNVYTRNGIPVCVRPLRAQTAQGPRVALARSEILPSGTEINFTLRIVGRIPDLARQAVKKEPISAELLHEWFSYGQFHGLGSWRNAGWGRFTYEMERIEAIA